MFEQKSIPPPPDDFSIRQYLEAHPFFAAQPKGLLDIVAPSAIELRLQAEQKVFRQDTAAEHFYVVLDGEVAVEVPALAGFEPARLQLLGPGKVLGWSWLIPPYRWHFDARAVKPTRLLQLDGKSVRERCRADPALGYRLLEQAAAVMMERLEEARMRVIEGYKG